MLIANWYTYIVYTTFANVWICMRMCVCVDIDVVSIRRNSGPNRWNGWLGDIDLPAAGEYFAISNPYVIIVIFIFIFIFIVVIIAIVNNNQRRIGIYIAYVSLSYVWGWVGSDANNRPIEITKVVIFHAQPYEWYYYYYYGM